jgi:S1-C subfamily serine protease
MRAGAAKIALAFLLLPFAAGLASPVIDDAALEQTFVDGLLRPGVEGLDGGAATRALAAAEGRSAAVARRAGTARDYDTICRSVVVVGSISHCRECDAHHMDAVSTGWVASADGRILTNHHVIEDAEAGELGVMTFDGAVYPVRAVLAADRAGDAAVLGLGTVGVELPALRLAEEAKTGEGVRVVGHPDGRFYTLTEGIVSRVFAQAADGKKSRRIWVSVTADYGAGSSGAPVLNAAGEVVAMVSSTAALLADADDDKKPEAGDVQMVFKDCVSPATMRRLLSSPTESGQ